MNEEEYCQKWREEAYECPKQAGKPHSWHTIAKTTMAGKTGKGSEHATMLMCGACFHVINLHEAFKHKEPTSCSSPEPLLQEEEDMQSDDI